MVGVQRLLVVPKFAGGCCPKRFQAFPAIKSTATTSRRARLAATFGATARDETDLEQLTAEMLRVVDTTARVRRIVAQGAGARLMIDAVADRHDQ